MSPRSALASRRRATALCFALASVSAALAGCDSNADTVCQDIANCSHGGSDDWVTACQTQANELEDEAESSGCNAAYDGYFSCAEAHFECHGNESRFDGCDARKDALDTCLASGRARNACGALDAKLAACGTASTPSSAAPTDDTTLEPCTTGGVCSAQCYTAAIADICAPKPAELSAFAECASHCVP
jgi:hypothetical protein